MKERLRLPAISDFDPAVDMQHVPGSIASHYGISFWYLDSNNYYVFFIGNTSQTYSVWAYPDTWGKIVDWIPMSAILPDKVIHIGVSARGSSFTFFINNEQVGVAEDTGISTVSVGMAAWINKPNAGDKFSVAVDNFELHFNNLK